MRTGDEYVSLDQPSNSGGFPGGADGLLIQSTSMVR